MKILAFATHLEAAATLQGLGMISDPQKAVYVHSQGLLIITGMGIVTACAAIAPHLANAYEVWNIGFAGSLRPGLPFGTIHEVGYVGKHISIPSGVEDRTHMMAKKANPHCQIHPSGVRLVSSDYPIFGAAAKSSLQEEWDIVDMEGYGIAKAAASHGISCRLFKIISDFTEQDDHHTIATHCATLSQLLADFTLSRLKA